ncbi:hypothetical protein D3C80_1554530 [compost metagenome]
MAMARDAAAKASLVPAHHAATARALEAHMVAQVTTAHLAVKEVEMAVVMVRERPARLGRVPSFPTSAHIRMTMARTPMTLIKRHECRSKGTPST